MKMKITPGALLLSLPHNHPAGAHFIETDSVGGPSETPKTVQTICGQTVANTHALLWLTVTEKPYEVGTNGYPMSLDAATRCKECQLLYQQR